MLKRSLLTSLLVVLACAPAAAASPRAHASAQAQAEEALEEVVDLRNGRGVRTGRELTDALRELTLSAHHLRGAVHAKAAQILDRPQVGGSTVCGDDFCVHGQPSLTLTAETILGVAQDVHDFETGTLSWREPPSDGDGRVDIYLKDVGDEGLFGYAQSDGGDTKSQSAYLVIDNDFDPAQYGGTDALESLRVTLAHEYAHVLQYGYDILADGWHFESSAVWMEQRMYPEILDWLRYVQDRPNGQGWGSLTELSLTYFEPNPDSDDALDPRTAKPYGDVVWNQFLSSKYGSAGDAIQLSSWQNSNGLDVASTAAYDTAIRDAGGPGLTADFAAFSAAVAEWRVPAAPFPTPAGLPDVERRGELVTGGAMARLTMDHLSFAFYDVLQTDGPIRLVATFPDGMSAAIALVAREGTIDGGQVSTELLELPDGGVGGVTVSEPSRFYASGGRITAVLVNADASHGPWSNGIGDWEWVREDQLVSAGVSSDTRRPRASLRRFRLRSRDGDRLEFEAELRQDGRTVGTRDGSIRAGATRRLRIAGGEPRRARLVVRMTDPSGNTKRLADTVHLGT